MENYVTLCREISQLTVFFGVKCLAFCLKGKPVRIRRGPATVLGSFIENVTVQRMGRPIKRGTKARRPAEKYVNVSTYEDRCAA